MPFFRSLPSDAAVPHIFALRPDLYGPFNREWLRLTRTRSLTPAGTSARCTTIAVSCFFSFMNRLVLGHGIVPDPDKFVERGRRHFELGYLAQHPELYGVGGEEAETSARLE